MVESPQRIWIEADDECPYFYEAHELHDVEQDVIEYVRADLHAALEAKLADLAAENERLKQEIAATQEKLIRANDELIQRNSKALSSTGAVKVKALEWEETHTRRSEEDPTTEWNGGFEADSALGYYKISMGFGSDAYYWAVTNPLGDDVGSDFEDPSYAKAAAQQDYERRILAALEPAAPEAPASRTVTEEMVEALKRIRDTAMEHTLAARIPECGVFGGIAQDADWLLSELTAAMEAGQ